MAKKYHRDRCESRVRMQIVDKLGRKITLTGQHAFEWSIVLEKDNKISITTFKNRSLAIKDFNKYLK